MQANISSDTEVARLGALPVAVISDTMDKLGIPTAIMDYAIARQTGKRMAGRARTIDRALKPLNASQAEVAPDLLSAPVRVVDEASAGDIIVMAHRGEASVSGIGDNMSTRAKYLGVAGVIVDGAIRDKSDIEEMGLTVFARGTISRSAAGRLITLSLNEPVICGGVWVCPGDVIVGDADGIVVVPKAKAAEVADFAENLEKSEQESRKFIQAGNTAADSFKKFKVK